MKIKYLSKSSYLTLTMLAHGENMLRYLAASYVTLTTCASYVCPFTYEDSQSDAIKCTVGPKTPQKFYRFSKQPGNYLCSRKKSERTQDSNKQLTAYLNPLNEADSLAHGSK